MNMQKWKERSRIQNELMRKLLCEFMATTFLIYVGLAVDAQMVLSRAQLNSHPAHSMGWGLALLFAVQMALPVSGAHLNPAVSLCAWLFDDFPLVHFLLYSIVQISGAFVDKIAEFDGGVRAVYGPKATAVVFATYPGEHLSILGAVIDQTCCTAMLCFIIGVITDKHAQIPRVAQPTMMGLMLTAINMAFGLNAGNAANPARDFGPRLFTLLVGYGWEVFSYNSFGWFWVPIVCPFFGAIVGTLAYQLLVSAQLGPTEEEKLLENSTNSSAEPSLAKAQ
ncbi:hypothetical protein niasHT_034635 [Heterodera trifolii]|uniref:Uncharacterized protein n=1 Tax=Heterodera trifolii TaxID=157864 RepID=A0ABD2IIV4_9BILA